MTFGLIPFGEYADRVYLECEGCGKHHTIHAYGVHKTRAHAALRGWQVRAQREGMDLCPDCQPTTRPRLLDLFCCEGGASVGYERAGFEVVGVDIDPQPLYPFTFHQADALGFVALHGHEFDAIHASPPCQGYTTMTRHADAKSEWPRLIQPVRDTLVATGKPYVIENVVGARSEMVDASILHGGMFGLGVDRPRLFETNWPLLIAAAPRTLNPVGVYGREPDGRRLWTRADGTELRAARSVEEAREAMGMPWASWNGVREAIPPAYTEFIGRQLISACR
jgi:DNA (cytosine-5)-methyltransferase 1